MLKIILGYIKSWLTYQPDEYALNTIYNKCLLYTSKASTLADLFQAKKFIKTHAQLTNKYNMPILQERQAKLETLWNHRYKLWKNRGY